MIPLHFTAMLGLLLAGWYVDYRIAPLLPSVSGEDGDGSNFGLSPTSVGSVDCTDTDDAHDVATAAENAANGVSTDACTTAHGDASAPECDVIAPVCDASAPQCDVIAESRGLSSSLPHSSSALSVVRASELAVRREVGVDDTRLALPVTVPEWAVTAVDIASEALAIVSGRHPYAELLRWAGLRSDAPLWQEELNYRYWQREAAAITIQRWTRTEFRRWLEDVTERRSLERRIHEWLNHKERANQHFGNVVPASGIDQTDVNPADVIPPARSMHYVGDVLRRPSYPTSPPSGHRRILPDDEPTRRGVVQPEASTARRRLPITLLRFDPPFDRPATRDPPFPNSRTRWPHQ
ncbi:hypothetical protein MTO96_012331 [Rhipicephalus appendiculatus]